MSQVDADSEEHRSPEYPPVGDPVHPHPEEPKRMTTPEARQAVNVRGMQLVLVASVILVILGFLAVYFWA